MKRPKREVWEGIHPEKLRTRGEVSFDERRKREKITRQLMAHETLTKLDSGQRRFLRDLIRVYVDIAREGLDEERAENIRERSLYEASRYLRENTRKGARVEVLDIGTETSDQLRMLKILRDDRKMVTHGTTVTPDEVRADVQHFVLAEALPESFRERFKVVMSDRCFPYTVLPDLALRNAVKALAPKGKAILEVGHIGRGFEKLFRDTGANSFAVAFGGQLAVRRENPKAKRMLELIEEYYNSRRRTRLTREEVEELKEARWDNFSSTKHDPYRFMIKKAFLLELQELQRTARERKLKIEFFDKDGEPIPVPESIFDLKEEGMYLHVTRLN